MYFEQVYITLQSVALLRVQSRRLESIQNIGYGIQHITLLKMH